MKVCTMVNKLKGFVSYFSANYLIDVLIYSIVLKDSQIMPMES